MRRREPTPPPSATDQVTWAEFGIDGDVAWGLGGRIEAGWRYEMSLRQQNSRWVVSGLRVFPETGDPRDASTSIPPGGLTARHLRQISFGRRSALAAMSSLSQQAARIARRYRPLGRGTARLVQIAQCYVEALKNGSRKPNADVAAQLRENATAIRDAIHQARVQGILSTTRQRGVIGGELTEKGKLLLMLESRSTERSGSTREHGRMAKASQRLSKL